MKLPKVSVIIPVYNGEKFIQDAINSILNQTFTDFELIIINDGSNDSSVEIIKLYDDPRIIFINNVINTGLPKVRNQGLYASHGEYIAWLDCDDISVSERLQKQVQILDENPNIGICGAWVKVIGAEQDKIIQFPLNSEYIKASMLFNNCIANSTVMMRASCTRDIGLRFNLDHHLSQDYGLWVRIPEDWDIINLPEVLTLYRLHKNQVTAIYKKKQMDTAWDIQREQLIRLGVFPSAQEKTIHIGLSDPSQNTFNDFDKLLQVKKYIDNLHHANKKYRLYNKKMFKKVLLERWLVASNGNTSSIYLIIISFWMRLKFEGISFDLFRRAIKKINLFISKALKK